MIRSLALMPFVLLGCEASKATRPPEPASVPSHAASAAPVVATAPEPSVAVPASPPRGRDAASDAPPFESVSALLCKEYELHGDACRADAFEVQSVDLDGEAPSEWVYVLRSKNGPELCHVRHACFTVVQARGSAWRQVLVGMGGTLELMPRTGGANRPVAVVGANSACNHQATLFRWVGDAYAMKEKVECLCDRATNPAPCSSKDVVVLQ